MFTRVSLSDMKSSIPDRCSNPRSYIPEATLITTVPCCQGSMLWSQYSAIFANFRRKNGVLLKSHCYDQIFAKSSISLSKKMSVFLLNFSAKFFKNHNIGPMSKCFYSQIANCKKKYFMAVQNFTTISCCALLL
jgi:hypothetical protein